MLCAAFLALGTSLGYCATDGGVWSTAHLGAVAFYGEGRPWLIAIRASLAAFSRYPLLLALPGYAARIYDLGGVQQGMRMRSISSRFFWSS
jgi:hypothetical protein